MIAPIKGWFRSPSTWFRSSPSSKYSTIEVLLTKDANREEQCRSEYLEKIGNVQVDMENVFESNSDAKDPRTGFLSLLVQPSFSMKPEQIRDVLLSSGFETILGSSKRMFPTWSLLGKQTRATITAKHKSNKKKDKKKSNLGKKDRATIHSTDSEKVPPESFDSATKVTGKKDSSNQITKSSSSWWGRLLGSHSSNDINSPIVETLMKLAQEEKEKQELQNLLGHISYAISFDFNANDHKLIKRNSFLNTYRSSRFDPERIPSGLRDGFEFHHEYTGIPKLL